MSENRLENLLGSVGAAGGGFLRYLGGLAYLARESFIYAVKLTFKRDAVSSFRKQAIAAQMVRVGVRSIPIVSMVILFVGMILAFQMAYVLRQFGTFELVPAVVAVAMLRELSPLLTAVVLSGYAGASIAAEIGTMVVSEEIEALETSGLNPIRFLVMPRVVASTIMLFCLTIFSNLVGVFGGFIIGTSLIGISPWMYYSQTVLYLKTQDLVTGLIKSVAFGALIALIACHEGLRVRGGAEGVGRATTQSVVFSIVAIIVTDLFFSAIFYALQQAGWL
jgi:phospholipid/cholesterol/gamma-HCH transport system permease protein